MKHRFAALLLAGAMTLSLAACGQQAPSNDPQADEPDISTEQTVIPDGALVIAEQGMFSAGGTVISSDGTFDVSNYYMSREGSTSHVDHANVLYQIPAEEAGLPMVFLHGYGQSRMGWMTTPDGREGWSDLFLRMGHSVFLIDQPRRGEAGQTSVAGTMTTEPSDQLVIAEQGMFSAGGTVISSDGTFDVSNYYMSREGSTSHVDHANVLYQIPAEEAGLPMVFLHGYGQSRMGWMTTPDGREGWSDLFLRMGHSVFLIDQPRRGEAGQTSVAGTMTTEPSDQTWYISARTSFPVNSKGSSISLARQMSFRFPLESKKCSGLPSPSVSTWTFVVNPPRLRPVASLRPLF